MTGSNPFPLRQVHLDFHTGPDIPEIGADFDAEVFAKTFDGKQIPGSRRVGLCRKRQRLLGGLLRGVLPWGVVLSDLLQP